MCRGISVFVLSLSIILLIIFGTTVEETQVNEDQINWRNILSKSQLPFEDIRQRTKEMIVEGGKVVAKLLASFPDMGAQAIQSADVDDVRGHVAHAEYLLQAAQAAGKNITICIGDEPQRADNFQEIALSWLKICYTHVWQATTDITKRFELLISEVQLEMVDIEEELLNCFLLSNSTMDIFGEMEASSCLATEIDRLVDKQQKIKEEILNVQHWAEDVLRQGTVCLRNEEQKALKLEFALIKDIEECTKGLS